jgi:RNA polymerase sigma-70 factor, ECF subfamily
MAVTSTRSADHERGLLHVASSGDDEAFRRIVEPHRPELHAHCYRMLGSVQDAEDALQEALLRAWRGLPGFEGRSALRSWLYRVATNACLDAIAQRSRRVLPIDYGPPRSSDEDPGTPLVESVWIEPYPDEMLGLSDGRAGPEARYEQHEAIELAFVAALQHLPARQRSVLILREVLGFSAHEVSESLGTSVASVNSALQRARKAVDERLPDQSQQETLRSLGDERVSELVRRYVDAMANGDAEELRALLAADATFSMPPWADWWRGRDEITDFVRRMAGICPVSRPVHTRANAQPAIAYYSLNSETGRYEASAIDVLTFEGPRIKEITGFVTERNFPRFGLPLEHPGD